MIKPSQAGFRPWENHTTALRARKRHSPLPAAPPKGGERSEPVSRMFFMPYDTDSQSRNVLASPLGEEGHEVAKGCTRVGMIMILDVDVTAERRHYNTHRPAGDTTTLGAKGPVKPKNPWAEGPSILRTFPLETFIRHKSNKFLTHQYSILCLLNSLITGNRKDRHRGQDLNK